LDNQKKHIVIITHYFTPFNNVAANRMNAFAKYLPKEKYDVSILTILRPGEDEKSIEFDSVHVNRIKSGGLFKLFSFEKKSSFFIHKLKTAWNVLLRRFVNHEESWIKNGLHELNEMHQKNPIDIVISSFGPVSPHKLACQFKKEHKNTGWITDMRDEMSANPFIDDALRLEYQKIEELVALHASGLASVSQPIVDDFKEKLGPELKYKLIKNGFDHERKPKSRFNDVFTFTYVGTFYGVRKPSTFFKALIELLKEQSDFNFEIKLIGTPNNFNIPKELESHIKWVDKVSNTEAVDFMESSDVNVIIHPRSKVKGIYTGKLFEYLSVHKPILGLLDTDDVAAQLIEECKAGFYAEFDDITGIKENIMMCFELWKKKEDLPYESSVILEQHRSHQVKNLDQLIEEVIGR
jgi:glycosyltransferase involved in cell wall biosynthesis